MKKQFDSNHPFLEPTHDEISQYARRLYAESGCIDGRDLSNWLQAEDALRSAAHKSIEPVAPPGRVLRRGKRSLNDGPFVSDLDSKAVIKQLDEEFSPAQRRSPTSL